jgi:hypothetical protein
LKAALRVRPMANHEYQPSENATIQIANPLSEQTDSSATPAAPDTAAVMAALQAMDAEQQTAAVMAAFSAMDAEQQQAFIVAVEAVLARRMAEEMAARKAAIDAQFQTRIDHAQQAVVDARKVLADVLAERDDAYLATGVAVERPRRGKEERKVRVKQKPASPQEAVDYVPGDYSGNSVKDIILRCLMRRQMVTRELFDEILKVRPEYQRPDKRETLLRNIVREAKDLGAIRTGDAWALPQDWNRGMMRKR